MIGSGAGRPGAKKGKLGALIIVAHPAGGNAPSGMPGMPDHGEPDADDQPGGTAPKPGESMFHDQSESCATCEHFDQNGNGGVGECKMNVPEADFSKADPDASWCKWYESGDEEQPAQAPTPAQQPAAKTPVAGGNAA